MQNNNDKKTVYPKVNPKQSFPAIEEEVLKNWKENKTFEKSIENRIDSPEFNFYDGPPFATGTPHYGHLLGGTLKDIVPRYKTMKGYRVDRKFGWDCHGLPIENIVEKKLNISGKEDIEDKVGVYEFNEQCRENVFGYVDEWKKTVDRMGRWVDMENSYKTMDADFMESVWWVYKKLYDKGLIYEGYRVVPYCPRCSTPLSNFEVNQGYKDKQDKSITVKFKVKDSENKYILAWTTTPWTLMANLGLAVGADIDYVELKDNSNNETYVLAKDRLKNYYKNEEDYTVVREYKGECLAGIKYEAVFPDFGVSAESGNMPTGMQLGENAYSVVLGHHVTTDSGTGIVHIAPAYGEDDNLIGKEQKLGFVSHIDDTGKVENSLNNDGEYVFDYNETAIKELKERGDIVKIETIDHSYPHCWRCDTPLVYRAISAWYVKVEDIRDKMVENNKKINWVPENIKTGRFGKWIENARDWNISRNRYWGSAIPVWQNLEKSEEICIGSVEELYQLNKDFGDITKVIFVRHGRTDYNEKHLQDSENNAMLTDMGKDQAEKIAEQFKDEKIDAIYCSPLTRCKDTIIPLAEAKGLEINEVEDFREVKSPDLQDKEFSCKNYKWENGYGGGETIKEVYERVEKSFKKILEENAGKTIVVCSHGDPTFLARKSLHDNIDYETQKYSCGKYLENNPKHGIDKMYGVEYVYTKTKKAVDLHKHFVDDILVKNSKGKKARNVLAVHGRTSIISDPISKKESWPKRKQIVEERGINFDMPQFDPAEDPTYESWKETYETLDFSKYDTVYTSSLGGAMTVKYILENQIKLDRLVMFCPGASGKYEDKPNLEKFYEELYKQDLDLTNLVKEIIVVHSKDDDIVSFNQGKLFTEKTGAKLLEVNGFKHKFSTGRGLNLIATVIESGMPLKRIPEVLDCWFESGSMPYASKHYPFSGNDKVNFKNEFFISRHGIAENNEMGIESCDIKNQEKFGLTKKGLENAKKEAEKFENKFDIIICSPFRRTQETAQQYLKTNKNAELITDDRLIDVNVGIFDEKPYLECEEFERNNDVIDGSFPEGEGYKDVEKRMLETLREYNEKYEGKNILIVSHGGALQVLMDSLKYGEPKTDQQLIDKSTIVGLNQYQVSNFKFPGDFIAEGIDQTRGWFYTLLILGTALFDNTPFLNVIVNGTVLADDGRKMSKSLQNYPDPKHIFDAYGADAMRFYMMNSPVVEAQDFRFSEAGVEEVVKKTILPLWNTFYFFTTYANIDEFKPEEGNVYFVRHGQTDNNLNKIVNGGDADGDELNKTGFEQAHNAGQMLDKNIKFDLIITSGLNRANQTAETIKSYLDYDVEIIEDKRFMEQTFGEFKGMKHADIVEKYNCKIHSDETRVYRNNKVEPLKKFNARVSDAYREVSEKYKGKNILIVAHGGTFRAINSVVNNLTIDEAYYEVSGAKNSVVYKLPNYTRNNELDKWIISQLHNLIKEVETGFESYKLADAARPIVKFMDNLTNWYIRRSRKRFWKSENDGDKLEAYNTLYEVLVELTKVIAPFMPFVSEHIFKALTGKESVHLENFPEYVPGYIMGELNKQMDKTQKIINLGLAWRVNNKLRVRQPVNSISIGEDLGEYYKEIIAEELNVKEVIILENTDELAKKICKPNAKLLGPKFGKDMKFIMTEAKSGNFEELENGQIKVGEFILEDSEYEIAFEKKDKTLNIEAGFGMVIAMDDNITPELKAEGNARDIVRFIQDARKEADYMVDDRINISLEGSIIEDIKDFISYIEGETLSTVKSSLDSFDLEKKVKVDGEEVVIKLKK